MIRLMAEKVQKVSERVGFPSGNIQIDPVKSCGKNTDHQRKDKAEYLSSNDRIQGISRKSAVKYSLKLRSSPQPQYSRSQGP